MLHAIVIVCSTLAADHCVVLGSPPHNEIAACEASLDAAIVEGAGTFRKMYDDKGDLKVFAWCDDRDPAELLDIEIPTGPIYTI